MTNSNGLHLIDMCKSFDLSIVNGRFGDDKEIGDYTCYNKNGGCSTVDYAIGGFTVTSFAVSRGRLASLVGKRFAVVGLRVHFAGIHSLFALILLPNKIMIMFCIADYWCGVH